MLEQLAFVVGLCIRIIGQALMSFGTATPIMLHPPRYAEDLVI